MDTTSSRLFLPNKALNLLNRRDLELQVVQLLAVRTKIFIFCLSPFKFNIWFQLMS